MQQPASAAHLSLAGAGQPRRRGPSPWARALSAWQSLGDTLSIEQAPVYLTELDGDPLIPSVAHAGPWGEVPASAEKGDVQGWLVASEFAIDAGFGVAGLIMGVAAAAIVPAGSLASGPAGDAGATADQLNGRFFPITLCAHHGAGRS